MGNPNNEVTVKQLAEMMTKVHGTTVGHEMKYVYCHSNCWVFDCLTLQVYSKVSAEPPLVVPTVDVSSKEFYGEGYDDSDKRIPDMTIINKQLGTPKLFHSCSNSIPAL